MRIDIITLFPEFFNTYIQYSILKRAQKNKLVEINIHNLRDYSTNKQNNIDDYQFGGGAGMVLCIEPIDNCIKHLKKQVKYDEIIYLSPDGEKLNQKICNSLSLNNNLILLCGHYKGIDQRARDHLVTKEISIGDYVITGGEVAAAILSDAIIRLIPGVISDGTSALTDTFQDDIIAPPIYTRPANYNGWRVPDVLLSGNKRLISEWRDKESLRITKNRRPDLLK